MRWTARRPSGARGGRWARISGLCCIVLLAALMPAAQAQVAPQEVDVALDYGCPLAPGPRQVSIRVEATFPGAAVAGRPIQPQDVTVRVTLPPAMVADLTEQGAARVAGAVDLATTVAQNGKSSDSAWTGLAAPSTLLPKTGELTLMASGPVPTTTATGPGDVRFTAGLLGLSLTPKKADGSATDPATMPLACTLNPGQAAHLVTVPVSEGSAPPASPPASNAPETTSPQADRALGIITGPGANGQQPAGASVYEDVNVEVIEECLAKFDIFPGTVRGSSQAYLAGYSNAKKLNGALVAGYPVPALFDVNPERPGRGATVFPTSVTVVNDDGDSTVYRCPIFAGDLNYQGRMELPPARATFLAFGFMPVTATAHISQVDGEPLMATLYQLGADNPPPGWGGVGPYDIFSTAKVSLRLSDVTVNGVPLDVGGNCHTTEHLTSPDSPYQEDRMVLFGGSSENSPRPKFSHTLHGGALAGTVSIPSFTGCVTPSGEDLTPLLDATVSGPGNYIKMLLGPLCQGASFAYICERPSEDFTPNRLPYFNVSNGGSYTSTGEVTFAVGDALRPFRIKCPSVALSGAIPDASGPTRDGLGTLSLTFPRECTTDRAEDERWQVSMQGIAHIAGSLYHFGLGPTEPIPPRTLYGKITDVSLRFTGTNIGGGVESCTAVVTGANRLYYTNPPDAKLTLEPGTADQIGVSVPSENCPDDYFHSSSGSTLPVTMGAKFDLDPANITITSPRASEVVGP